MSPRLPGEQPNDHRRFQSWLRKRLQNASKSCDEMGEDAGVEFTADQRLEFIASYMYQQAGLTLEDLARHLAPPSKRSELDAAMKAQGRR